MKKNLPFISITILLFIFSSCNTTPDYQLPEPCFSTTTNSYNVFDEIAFNNCSQFSESYTWDFGDGSSSTEKFPFHTYMKPGLYTVSLLSKGVEKAASYSRVLYILGSTDLHVKAIYAGTTDAMSNCTVTLYNTETDYINKTNPVLSSITDATGVAKFKSVELQNYFIDLKRIITDTSFWANQNQIHRFEVTNEYSVNSVDIPVEMFVLL